MALGLVLGLPAGAVFFLAAAQAQRRAPGIVPNARVRLVLAATVAAGILFAISGLAHFLWIPSGTGAVTILVLLSLAVGLLLGGQLLRRLKPDAFTPT